MKRFKVKGVFVVLLVSAVLGGTGVVGANAEFLQTHYYLTPIGPVSLSVASLIQTAQTHGFTVIVRSGEEADAYRGSEPTQEPKETLLEADLLLYVDDGRFLLRVKGEDLNYEVRPAEDGYALVLIPHRDLAMGETLMSVVGSLQEMGILGAEVEMGAPTPFQKEAEKGPAPPAGVAIDSSLYALTVAADWFSYATSKGLTRVGLRVEVVAEKLPGGAISERFQPYIVSETDQLAKLLLPIHQLVDLARSSAIGYVRPPYRPQPAAP